MLEILFKLGIPTYTTTIYTPLSVNGDLQLQIAKQLPKTIGRIYGLEIYADGVTPDRKQLITTTDAQNLYMTLKDGVNNFYEDVRLSEMLNQFSGVPVTRPTTYLSVNIPNTIDLSTSFYTNPTGIVAGANSKTIALKCWYITADVYKTMAKNKMVMSNANVTTE